MAAYPKSQKKSKPRIKVIKPMSDKRLAIERDKKKAYEKVTVPYCQGCGATWNLSRSHLIPRSKRTDLIAEPRNIKTRCDQCHYWDESAMYWLLGDGEEVVNWLLEADWSYGILKLYKMKERIEELQINTRYLDAWVEEKLNLLK